MINTPVGNIPTAVVVTLMVAMGLAIFCILLILISIIKEDNRAIALSSLCLGVTVVLGIISLTLFH